MSTKGNNSLETRQVQDKHKFLFYCLKTTMMLSLRFDGSSRVLLVVVHKYMISFTDVNLDAHFVLSLVFLSCLSRRKKVPHNDSLKWKEDADEV